MVWLHVIGGPMSRKRNSRKGGKKARDFGASRGGGMRKHRASGKSQINRHQRMLAAREQNRVEEKRREEKNARRRERYATVRELMAASQKKNT